MGDKEICFLCDEETGAAGEDSCYSEANGDGPFCQECFDHSWCRPCNGEGEHYVRRNSAGEVDYLNGDRTNELINCTMCQGDGYRTL